MSSGVHLVRPWDQDVIDTALAFASLQSVESAEQVDSLLADLFKRYANVEPGQPRWNPASSVTLEALQRDHAEWVSWIEQIRRGKSLSKVDHEALSVALGAVKATPRLVKEMGRMAVVWHPWMTGLRSVYAYAAALMLDPRNKLLGHIGKCKFHRPCDRRYFIDWGGKRMEWCSQNHENTGGIYWRRWEARRRKAKLARGKQL